ncbi:MAG: hypothetical protein A2Y79_10775 [Deltaproteobacteria bacterium RBG_13_43_22]|nr:MAG: hypothetical protein A2Y79_10775 [Deltaproteobacteria bacterium RBG_13_43_22]
MVIFYTVTLVILRDIGARGLRVQENMGEIFQIGSSVKWGKEQSQAKNINPYQTNRLRRVKRRGVPCAELNR